MKAQRTRGGAIQKTRGFTLIELLVVVAIIIVLVGILMAALGGAKKAAYNSATQSELANLSTDCHNYFMDCDAYPGPLPAAYSSGTGGTAAASNKISGTQNMLLGLTYALYYYGTPNPVYTSNGTSAPGFAGSYSSASAPSPPSYGNWTTVPGASAVVNPTDATGPINYANSPIRNLKVYYPSTTKEVASIATTDNWTISSNPTVYFPTVVDHYPDPMPILYYRKTAGVDGSATVTLDSSGNLASLQQPAPSSPNSPVIAATGNSTPYPSYFYDDNKEYTQATALTSVSGQVFNENANIAFPNGLDYQSLAIAVSNVPISGTASSTINISSHGGFVLISAGYDHLYGTNAKNARNDDIMVIGGL